MLDIYAGAGERFLSDFVWQGIVNLSRGRRV